ncbi:hypothetical protein MCU_01257 [Bartonella elizabethae Re6043vi]|uniref:Uncharacterized protein n=2 Tax=Bartonella elizabethae TaxID=807 RepID=A0ABN0GJZ7_BAREL|nr:hypothetical protein MCU_01257 [Bartonella elizabethae Re6043vi]VEJ39539.1 Uncharacterised protein [Bartonella elizabethae]
MLKIKKKKDVKSGVFYANLTEAVEGLVSCCMIIIEQQMKIILEDAKSVQVSKGIVNDTKSYTNIKF